MVGVGKADLLEVVTPIVQLVAVLVIDKVKTSRLDDIMSKINPPDARVSVPSDREVMLAENEIDIIVHENLLPVHRSEVGDTLRGAGDCGRGRGRRHVDAEGNGGGEELEDMMGKKHKPDGLKSTTVYMLFLAENTDPICLVSVVTIMIRTLIYALTSSHFLHTKHP